MKLQIPPALVHPFLETDLHAPVLVHRGPIRVVADENQPREWDGIATFEWLPRPQIRLEAVGIATDEDIQRLLDGRGVQESELQLPPIGELKRPERWTTPEGQTARFRREPAECAVGTQTRLRAIEFVVINGPEIWGSATSTGRTLIPHGRCVLSAGGWQVTLDARPDLSSHMKALKASGGFGSTHSGMIRRIRNGRFAAREARVVLDALEVFLSWLRGRWVGIAMVLGSSEEGTVWEDWGPPSRVDRYATGFSWFEPTLTLHAARVWPAFLKQWTDSIRGPVLRRAVAYWLAANTGRPIEVGFTLAVSGIDLVGWQRFVVESSMSNRSWDALPAAERIGRLVDGMSLPRAVPADLHELRIEGAKRLAKGQASDGPSLLAWARNRFVHPRPGAKSTLSVAALADAWLLALWYLELSILFRLDYRGAYKRRTDPSRWLGVTEQVPWAP